MASPRKKVKQEKVTIQVDKENLEEMSEAMSEAMKRTGHQMIEDYVFGFSPIIAAAQLYQHNHEIGLPPLEERIPVQTGAFYSSVVAPVMGDTHVSFRREKIVVKKKVVYPDVKKDVNTRAGAIEID